MFVLLEQRAGVADDAADQGAADIAEGFGEGVEGALVAQVGAGRNLER